MKLEQSQQAALIEKNFKNAFIASAHIQKQHNKSQYVFSKIPHPIFNCVVEAITSEHDAEKTIHCIWEDYQKNNTPHCWWITQRSEPKNLSTHLEQLGFQKGPTEFLSGDLEVGKELMRDYINATIAVSTSLFKSL